MSSVTFDSVQGQQLRAVATAFLRLRPWIVGPALAAALFLLRQSAAPRAQFLAVACGSCLMLSFFTFEAWLGRRRQVTQGWFFGSLLLTLSGISANCAVTGGLRSPMLPLLFAPLILAFSAFGRSSKSVLAGLYGAALTCLLVLLPAGVPFVALPDPTARALTLIATLTAALLLWVGVSGLTDAFGRASQELDRLREQALTALAARAQNLELLTQNLAHELKNPLSSIKGLGQLLAHAELAEKHERRREVLLTEVARAENIVKEYLSFSRPLQRLELAAIELEALLKDVFSLLHARAEVAGVTLVLTTPQLLSGAMLEVANGGLVIDVDRGRLEEALVNLVANAIEASQAGSTVTVTLTSDIVSVQVRIHNAGLVSAQTLERIGTPFFTTKPQGSGLGVVLAQNIVTQHGGKLDYTSDAQQGTTATLTLFRNPKALP